eukprot:6462060-Amphidinium_carterae.1
MQVFGVLLWRVALQQRNLAQHDTVASRRLFLHLPGYSIQTFCLHTFGLGCSDAQSQNRPSAYTCTPKSRKIAAGQNIESHLYAFNFGGTKARKEFLPILLPVPLWSPAELSMTHLVSFPRANLSHASPSKI